MLAKSRKLLVNQLTQKKPSRGKGTARIWLPYLLLLPPLVGIIRVPASGFLLQESLGKA